MIGGSLHYLYSKEEISELETAIPDMEIVERIMLKNGDVDIAMDTRRLIEYIQTATNRIMCLYEKLAPVFEALECDGEDSFAGSLEDAITKYRKRE